MRRRYAAGWRNFLDLYRPMADEWLVYDNSLARETLVALRRRGDPPVVADPHLWAIIQSGPPK